MTARKPWRMADHGASSVYSSTRARTWRITEITRHDPPCAMDHPEAVLNDAAARLSRLAPSHRDPESFHVEKSEIVAMLRRVAKEIA